MDSWNIINLISLIGVLLNGVMLLVLWLIKRSLVTHVDLAEYQREFDRRHDDIAGRVARLDAALDGMPSSEAISRLAVKLENACGSMRVVGEKVDGLGNTVNARIDGVDGRLKALAHQFDMVQRLHLGERP